MQLGLIGLGKMGFNMRERLRAGGHEVIGYDPRPEVTDVPTLAALAEALPAPRTVNPILTQRDLDPARPQPVFATGHADMVELDDGTWWAVFLATRPYAANLYNTGRETFLLPVTWADGWPTILACGGGLVVA